MTGNSLYTTKLGFIAEMEHILKQGRLGTTILNSFISESM